MKTTTATLIAAALLGGAVATTAPVFARGGGDHDHCAHHAAYHHGWGMDGDMDARINHMARALDLSKDQITSLRSIADKQRPQWRDIHDRMADNRRTLERLRGDDNADPS